MDRAVEAAAPEVGLGLDSLDRARELQGGAAPTAPPSFPAVGIS